MVKHVLTAHKLNVRGSYCLVKTQFLSQAGKRCLQMLKHAHSGRSEFSFCREHFIVPHHCSGKPFPPLSF